MERARRVVGGSSLIGGWRAAMLVGSELRTGATIEAAPHELAPSRRRCGRKPSLAMNGVVIGDRGALPARAEKSLLAGAMHCPRCAGTLRPHGHGRPRTVRGMGAATLSVTPRRARCTKCGATQILLPGALSARRADATEVIGHALAAKAAGAGFRTIATHLGRPASTVRRWLRRAPQRHTQWLYQRAVEHCTRIDRELLIRPAAQPTLLGHALNLLAGAALRSRDRVGDPAPPWSLIGALSHGHLLAPPLKT